MFTTAGAKKVGQLLFDNTFIGLLDINGNEISTLTWESYCPIPIYLKPEEGFDPDLEKGMKCYMDVTSSENNVVTATNANVFYFFDTETEQEDFSVYGVVIKTSGDTIYYKGELDTPITLQHDQRPRFQIGALSFTINFVESGE